MTENFNSHAHVERDFCRFCYLLYLNYFNSHAHVERDTVEIARSAEDVYFNSHAHVERDHRLNVTAALVKISTHTLTWSVTII